MIAWLVAVAGAADPAALRGPRAQPTAVVGLHDLSLAAPIGPVEVAVAMRTDAGATSLSAGHRWQLAKGATWQVQAGVSGGVVVPLVVPTVGIVVTPWVSAGPVRERWFVQGLFAAPMAASLAGGVRAPALAELQGGVCIGPATVGLRLGMGAIVAPGTDVSVATEGAILVSFRTPRSP